MTTAKWRTYLEAALVELTLAGMVNNDEERLEHLDTALANLNRSIEELQREDREKGIA